MVEQRLLEDTRFASRLELIKNSYIALDPEIEALENDLRAIHEEFQPTTESNSSWRKSYLVAASLVVISLTFIGYLMWFQNPTPESLYLSYMEAPPGNITVRGEQTDQLLERAMEDYEQGNYQSAREQLIEVRNSQPDHHGALFYSGICHLMLEQYQSALTVFKSFETLDSSEYYTASKWYLSLNLLKTNQIEMAKLVLEQLQQLQNGNYSKQAAELLYKLN